MSIKKELVLVTGGARSGKSDFALKLARELSSSSAPGSSTVGEERREDPEVPLTMKVPVLFVATAEPGDAEMEERIRLHRSFRPAEWHTLEEPLQLSHAISAQLASPGHLAGEIVVVDCLTIWVSNLLRDSEGKSRAEATDKALTDARSLLDCYARHEATFILVSNEVGLGLVPTHPLGRLFRDVLGKVNQVVAASADKVYLMVAGLPLELKALSSIPNVSQEESP